MTPITHDARRSATMTGLILALVSSASFGLSGSLARGLLDAGWSSGAAVTARVTVAALVLVIPGIYALRGRWPVLQRNVGSITIFGVAAVAGAQLCFFYAVSYLQVGVALLIEYLAPVVVVVWMWLRHGQRPRPLTVLGAALAVFGLVLTLDVLSGGGVNWVGVLWALGGTAGLSVYFLISAKADSGLPPISLAAGGLVVGAVVLFAAGASGLLPMRWTQIDAVFAGFSVPWWLPVLALGVITTAVAYATGVAAARRLGSRLMSFVGLIEVLAAVAFAWLLLGEAPRPVQFVGAALVLVGVVVVKLAEPAAPALARPVPEVEDDSALQPVGGPAGG